MTLLSITAPFSQNESVTVLCPPLIVIVNAPRLYLIPNIIINAGSRTILIISRNLRVAQYPPCALVPKFKTCTVRFMHKLQLIR